MAMPWLAAGLQSHSTLQQRSECMLNQLQQTGGCSDTRLQVFRRPKLPSASTLRHRRLCRARLRSLVPPDATSVEEEMPDELSSGKEDGRALRQRTSKPKHFKHRAGRSYREHNRSDGHPRKGHRTSESGNGSCFTRIKAELGFAVGSMRRDSMIALRFGICISLAWSLSSLFFSFVRITFGDLWARGASGVNGTLGEA
mmetsp:Transcript_82249/g.148438  ORF Transcript_82249/g.148438 Transcript_82249/m.148438 type:complete len:199 (+) Transcript_82249:373-969(+)